MRKVLNINIAYIYALIAVSCWASTSVIIKLLLGGLNSLQIVMISSLIATICLFILIVFQKKINLIKKLNIKDYIMFFLMGSLGIFGYTYLLYKTLVYLPAQEASIINSVWPIMVVVFAVVILKEKLTLVKSLALILSFLGVVVIITKGNVFEFNFNNYYGILLALSATLIYGLFVVLIKKFKYDTTISMMFYYLFATFISLVLIIFFSEIPKLNSAELLGLSWNGIFNSAIAYVCWAIAIERGNISKVSNIAFLTPFIALIYIYIFLGENIDVYSIAGLIIIVLGMIIQNDKKSNKDILVE